MQDDFKFLDELAKRYKTRRAGIAQYSQHLDRIVASAKAAILNIIEGHKKADAMEDAQLVELRKLEKITGDQVIEAFKKKGDVDDLVKQHQKLKKAGKEHQLESCQMAAAQVEAEITVLNKRKNLCRERAVDLEKRIKARSKK